MTEEEFAAKVENEGSVLGALEYGLKAEDITEEDSELRRAWAHLELAWRDLQRPLDWAEQVIDEIIGGDVPF